MADELRYGWNASAARYVDLNTGRFVSQDLVLGVMQDRIDASFARLDAMAQGVIGGVVPVEAWQEAFTVELRRAHTQMAALGGGGWQQMAREDWLAVGRQLRFEYGRLAQFAADVASGRLSIGQIRVRMGQYANHIWTSFWKQRTRASQNGALTEERRVLSAVESCPDCLNYAAKGWVAIGTLPEPGQNSVCKANCKCAKEYR